MNTSLKVLVAGALCWAATCVADPSKAPAKTMVPAVDAAIVALEGDPAHVLGTVTKMKFFFFDSGPEDRYAELYINVDPRNHLLEFHEKDPDYRKPLLLALTKGR